MKEWLIIACNVKRRKIKVCITRTAIRGIAEDRAKAWSPRGFKYAALPGGQGLEEFLLACGMEPALIPTMVERCYEAA